MKIMKKIFKNRILIVIVTVILTGSISVYAAGRYYATQVEYEPSNPNFNVDNMSDALDQLYTTQNTTVNNLNSQINILTGQVSAKDATISDLQSQVESLTAAASEKDYVTGTITYPTSGDKDFDLGFKPSKVILLVRTNNLVEYTIVTSTGYEGAYCYNNSSAVYNNYEGTSGAYQITDDGFKVVGVTPGWGSSGKQVTYYAFS